MSKATIAILGGAGNTGRRLARLLSRRTDCDLRLMGRSKASVDDAAARIAAETGGTLIGVATDSGDREGLRSALSGCDLVISATSATQNAAIVAGAALDLGIDYFDIHLSSADKWQALRAFEPELMRRRLQFVSDGGFHPGLPAVLVRYLAQEVNLTAAPVYSSFNVDWSRLSFGPEAADDFCRELTSMDPSAFRGGRWVRSWRNYASYDFGPPHGRQSMIAMGLEEMRSLPERYPALKETGFYVSGFGPAVDYLAMPLALAAMSVPSLRPMAARGLFSALRRFTRHDEWALLVCDGRGHVEGRPVTARLAVSHDDPYELTAVTAAAAVMEMLDGPRRPGLHAQGLYVDPRVFIDNLRGLGAGVSVSIEPD